MLKEDIIFPFVGFTGAVVYFICTNQIILSLVVFLMFTLAYFIMLRKQFKKYYSLIDRVHSCYHFINSFLITLSVKESFEDAYQSGIRLTNKKLNEQIAQITQMNVYDRVKYLRGYFNLGIYKMFLNILDLYQDQGGNILSMSDNLMRECTRTEKTLSETLSIGYKHIVEFILLWIMSTAILVFMRFTISDFYQMMLEQPNFMLLIFGYFFIVLISIILFFKSYTNLTIKEDSGT